MKKIGLKAMLIAALALVPLMPGCKCTKDCYFIDGTTKTNAVPASTSFSDEKYIWESWFFSTNTVPEKVVK